MKFSHLENQETSSSSQAHCRSWIPCKMTHCICELLWVKIKLRVLGFKTQEPMWLNCANKAASNIDYDFEIDRQFHQEARSDW